MTSLLRTASGRRVSAYMVFVTALCLLSSACGGGGNGQSPGVGSDQSGGSGTGGSGTGGGGSGSGSGSGVPPTTLSCSGYPRTTAVGPLTQTSVCLILQEFAQVTPNLSVTAAAGTQLAHGVDMLSSYVVYARIIAQAPDQGTATALAQSVVINTANGSVSATPATVALPENLETDFEVFTAPSTNLTLTIGAGYVTVDNYNATLQLTTGAGDTTLNNVQGQVTANNTTGTITANLSGSSWVGAGLTATVLTGYINVSHPTGYQAAFTATVDQGSANVDGKGAFTAGPPAEPVVVTSGSGAPINLKVVSGAIGVGPSAQ